MTPFAADLLVFIEEVRQMRHAQDKARMKGTTTNRNLAAICERDVDRTIQRLIHDPAYKRTMKTAIDAGLVEVHTL